MTDREFYLTGQAFTIGFLVGAIMGIVSVVVLR